MTVCAGLDDRFESLDDSFEGLENSFVGLGLGDSLEVQTIVWGAWQARWPGHARAEGRKFSRPWANDKGPES